MDALQQLLQTPPKPKDDAIESVEACFKRFAHCPFGQPFDRALWSGAAADRLGYAFVGGYRAALQRLLPNANLAARASLAATESGGGHPKAIQTRLDELPNGQHQLTGEKTFATLATVADEIIVVASRGEREGKNQLVLTRIKRTAPGVTLEERPATPFAPEVPHARVQLDKVVVAEADIFQGDGYTDYLKPFRTIEDTHVLAAALAHVIRTSRQFDFDPSVIEGALTLILALREVSALPTTSPLAHVTLSGLFRLTRKLIADHDPEWEKCSAEVRDRWHRDLGLLLVAETVRQKRTEAAWKALAEQP